MTSAAALLLAISLNFELPTRRRDAETARLFENCGQLEYLTQLLDSSSQLAKLPLLLLNVTTYGHNDNLMVGEETL